MKTLEDSFEVNPDLKLGTGDDELVETFVKTTKRTLGVAGNFINDDVII